MSATFTGLKDTDRLILEAIDDERDFLSICSVNKYLAGLCDENVFKKRIVKKYSVSLSIKPNPMSYKKFYLKLLYYIDKLKDEYGFNFNYGNPICYYILLNSRMFKFWKIRQAIEFGYTDLALFLSEKEKIIQPRMLVNLFLLSAKVGNKTILDYYLKRANFGEYEYNKAANQAELSGHFEIAKYLRRL